MLNEKKERELAYAATIQEIKSIENYDRVEYARIGAGWWVIVKKDQFKVGDLAVYFEVDSKVPETEAFEFLAKRKYAIKTLKMCGVISQGLVMSFDDLGLKAAAYKDGDFLTKTLGVTYYDPEDVARKAPSTDKYRSMQDRYKKLFKSKFGKFMVKREFTRKIMFALFGKKRDKKTDWPAWVIKTDEERCLSGDVYITTNEGKKRIADIVNHKLPVQVASVNVDTGIVEFKPIVSYQKYLSNTTPMLNIRFPMSTGCATRCASISCTADHKIYTQRGYVEAKDLTPDDVVYLKETTYSDPEILEFLYGNILGDGHIYKESNRVRFSFGQGEKHKEYVDNLYQLYSGSYYIKEPNGFNKEKTNYKFAISDAAILTKSINEDEIFISASKWKLTEKFLNKLTEKSLATWFMDDGSNYIDDKDNSHICFHTESYSFEEQLLLIDILKKKFDLTVTLQGNTSKSKYHYLRIANADTDKFLQLIAKYVVPCLRYKLPEKYRNEECYILNKKFIKVDTIIAVPIKAISNSKKLMTVYDIEVADNHNFFANGILTHNCQNMPWLFPDCKTEWIATEKIDGTSTTFTMKNDRKKELIVCSRNVVFNKPDKKCFYETNVYTEMAEKYNLENVLKTMIAKYSKNTEYGKLKFVTIQGETYGGNIQKRNYGKDHKLAVFNIIFGYENNTFRLNPIEGKELAEQYFLTYVPIVATNVKLPATCDEVVAMAHGESAVDGELREGLVFRSYDGKQSFKAVDPEFLLKYHNN